MSEQKLRGRQKGQTKALSVISDALLYPYEIHIDEYSYSVVDSTKPTNGFCGCFTALSRAVDKIIQYQTASKKQTYSLKEFLTDYKTTQNQIKNLLEI